MLEECRAQEPKRVSTEKPEKASDRQIEETLVREQKLALFNETDRFCRHEENLCSTRLVLNQRLIVTDQALSRLNAFSRLVVGETYLLILSDIAVN